MARIIGSIAASPVLAPRTSRQPVTKLVVAAATRVIDTLLLWQDRYNQRRHLEALDDRLLADMGLSRADAAGEARKPIWRA